MNKEQKDLVIKFLHDELQVGLVCELEYSENYPKLYEALKTLLAELENQSDNEQECNCEDKEHEDMRMDLD